MFRSPCLERTSLNSESNFKYLCEQSANIYCIESSQNMLIEHIIRIHGWNGTYLKEIRLLHLFKCLSWNCTDTMCMFVHWMNAELVNGSQIVKSSRSLYLFEWNLACEEVACLILFFYATLQQAVPICRAACRLRFQVQGRGSLNIYKTAHTLAPISFSCGC